MKKQKSLKWILTAVLVLALTVSLLSVTGVLAGLIDSTAKVQDELKTAQVSCTAGTDYTVTNTGNIPTVIRARIIVNWVDESGNVLANADGAYTLTPGSGWTHLKGSAATEGEWYYNQIVAPSGKTTALLTASVQQAPAGARLEIKVLAEAIQAAGTTSGGASAAQDAWGVRPSFSGTSVAWSAG